MFQQYLSRFEFVEEEADKAVTLGFCNYLEGFTHGVLSVIPEWGISCEELKQLFNAKEDALCAIANAKKRIKQEHELNL